jgi:hypothetical protein
MAITGMNAPAKAAQTNNRIDMTSLKLFADE